MSYVYEAHYRYPSNWPIRDDIDPKFIPKVKEARLEMSRDLQRETFKGLGAPPLAATADVQIRYLRRAITKTALQEAFAAALGAASDPPFRESMILCVWLCANAGWRRSHAIAAQEAEWAAAREAAASVVRKMRAAARLLASESTPGEQMIREVGEIALDAGVYADHKTMVAFCRRVALATVRARRHAG